MRISMTDRLKQNNKLVLTTLKRILALDKVYTELGFNFTGSDERNVSTLATGKDKIRPLLTLKLVNLDTFSALYIIFTSKVSRHNMYMENHITVADYSFPSSPTFTPIEINADLEEELRDIIDTKLI